MTNHPIPGSWAIIVPVVKSKYSYPRGTTTDLTTTVFHVVHSSRAICECATREDAELVAGMPILANTLLGILEQAEAQRKPSGRPETGSAPLGKQT